MVRRLKIFLLQYVYGYVQEGMLLLRYLTGRRTAKKIRFIIFARGRSGTTLLTSMLNSDPKVRCDGEILNHRVLSPRSFIDRKCSLAEKEIYGFKLLSYQARSIQRLDDTGQFLQELVRDGYKVIYLRRKNLVRHALSKALAEQTQTWHSQTVATTRPKIRVDVAELYESIRESARLESFENEAVTGVPHLSLYYERDLETAAAREATMGEISRFLGVPLAPPVTSLVKLSSNRLSDFIENADELVAFLKQTEFAEHLDDAQ